MPTQTRKAPTKAPGAQDEAPKQWSVVTRDGNRTLFRGTEKDGRAFVVNNFPRVHAEAFQDYGPEGPEPDVYLVAPGGKTKHAYTDAEWSDE